MPNFRSKGVVSWPSHFSPIMLTFTKGLVSLTSGMSGMWGKKVGGMPQLQQQCADSGLNLGCWR